MKSKGTKLNAFCLEVLVLAVLTLIFSIFFTMIASAKSSNKKAGETKTYESYVAQAAKEINKQRKDNGKENIKVSRELQTLADIRSKELLESFSHTRPNGERFFSVFEEIGYGENEMYAAENIAAGKENVKDVVKQWMESAGHKKNILTGEFTHIGISRAYDKDSKFGYYWVLILADMSK